MLSSRSMYNTCVPSAAFTVPANRWKRPCSRLRRGPSGARSCTTASLIRLGTSGDGCARLQPHYPAGKSALRACTEHSPGRVNCDASLSQPFPGEVKRRMSACITHDRHRHLPCRPESAVAAVAVSRARLHQTSAGGRTRNCRFASPPPPRLNQPCKLAAPISPARDRNCCFEQPGSLVSHDVRLYFILQHLQPRLGDHHPVRYPN
jgi:hypothetical protein